MTKLTADEKRLLCLALDEYAAGFSMTLTEEENQRIRDLAARLREAKIEAVPEP